MKKIQKFLVVFIMLLAIFFRYYKIWEMPGGLFPDEAANGLDINLMQQGHLQPFYERGNGREALFFYFEWGSVALFGKTPWAMHATSALGGVLAVLFCFLLTRRLFLLDDVKGNSPAEGCDNRHRATNIALLAAFLMAVSTWHVVLSRTAFRATLIPFFTAMTFYFMLCAYQSLSLRKRLLFAFLTGASFALGFYTYIAYRIIAPIMLAVLLWPLLAKIKEKRFWKTVNDYKLLIISFAIAFLVIIFPLAKYFYQHPGSFVGRAGQVSIFNQTLYTVNGQQLLVTPPINTVISVAGEVFKRQFMAFFTSGDLNWRQNISGYPFLSPLVSPVFGAALVIMLYFAIRYFFAPRKKSGWWKYFLLISWLFGMMLPVVATAEGIPHSLRGIGVIPACFIISAWGIYEFYGFLIKIHTGIWRRCALCFNKDVDISLESNSRSSEYKPFGKRLVDLALKLAVAGFFAALILQTYFLYFVYAYNDPINFYYFRSDLTPVSQYLRQHCDKEHTYLVLDKFSVQTTDFLTSDPKGNFSDKCNVPYIQVDPENSWQLSNLKLGDQIVFTQSSIFDATKFKKFHPEAHLAIEYRNKFNQAIMAVYKIK